MNMLDENLDLRGKIRNLEAQCQRDFALAAEWKARYEAMGVELEVAKTAQARAAGETELLLDAERRTRDAALARAEEAERRFEQVKDYVHPAIAQRAESECAALRAELRLANDHCRVLDEANAKLQAQYDTAFRERGEAERAVERLRAELRAADGINGRALKQLATANALLQAAETYISEALWEAWQQTKRAHLAACSGHAKAKAEPVTFEQAWAKKEAEGYSYGEDALEGVRLGWEICMAERNPARTAAEQRVLGALESVPEWKVRDMTRDTILKSFGKAELARREGK